MLYALPTTGTEENVAEAAGNLYKLLTDRGVAVLYDNRDVRAGEKFADADLLGIPYRVVISAKTLAAKKCEIKRRTEKETHIVDVEEAIKILAQDPTKLL